MAAALLTDSSDYSEDFEGSYSETWEFSEQDIFPKLFDFLESSLQKPALINYKDEYTPQQLAVGKFLATAITSKQDIIDKLDWEYSVKKETKQTSLRFECNNGKFPKVLKSIMCESKCEVEYMNMKSKRNQRKTVEEVRSKLISNLGAVIKDKIQAESMLESESSSVSKKSDELQDQYYWTRFCELLKSLIPKKIIYSTLSEKQKSEVKSLLDNYYKQPFVIKNIIALEDSDYILALGNRRSFQSSNDRKIEISDIFTSYNQVENILSLFLTFTTKAKDQQLSLCPFPSSMLLNRAFINFQRPSSEDSLSQLIFYTENPTKLMESWKKYDMTSAEEEVNPSKCFIEVKTFDIHGIVLNVIVDKQTFVLKAASVNELCSLPNSPTKSEDSKNYNYLFVLTQESFYIERRKPRNFLRMLRESEINELFNVYLYRKTDNKIPNECFPDIGKEDFKYKYCVIRDLVILSSGVFAKHWIVQMRSPENKKSNSESVCVRMCKWDGCMCPLVTENHLARMITEFSQLTTKAKGQGKKSLNPPTKLRTASEAMVLADLCVFHNNLRSIMRNEGLLTKSFIYDHSPELWKATQAGLGWQEHLSESNKLNHLCSGLAKSSLVNYFEECNKNFSSKASSDDSNEGSHSTQKLALIKEIESLKKLKEAENNCSNDLKRIITCGANNGYMRYVLNNIQEALGLQTPSKSLKIRNLRDQIESFMSLRMQNFVDNSTATQASFRISTAKPAELNSTMGEAKKTKDDMKKNVSPYYDAKLRVIKRFQRSRIPKTSAPFFN